MVFRYDLHSPNPGSPAAHLAAPISAIDVTMTLDDAADQLSAPGEFTIGTGENSETITYTSLVGNVVSGMSRGQGGTIAAPWGIGTEVKRGFTAYDMFAIIERLVSVDSDGVAGVTFAGVSGTTQQAAINNGYIPLNTALTTITLPATAAVGDVVAITGYGAGLWKLAQNASQLIHFLSLVTTTGTGGYIQATTRYDTIIVRCVVANTTWVVENAVGNLDVI